MYLPGVILVQGACLQRFTAVLSILSAGTCPVWDNGYLPSGVYKPFITNKLFLSCFFSPVFLLS
ncbi:hypothetical protein M141_2816 [Bacteroides fragilis str. S38L5]|nr:hypothetical protein M141_2816 [Bacteroides fragilis str. S38L5]EYB13847.1 hypothetical protein M140_2761 [Bacteroides fragilis str. S38L3]